MTDTQPTLPAEAPASKHGVAAGLSGVISAIFTFPTDTVRTRKQVLGPHSKYQGNTVAVIKTIFREEGFRALFRGLTPNCIALAPSMGIFFYMYESMKNALGPDHLYSHAGSACTSWVVMCAATNPLWMLKVRMQTQPQIYGSMGMIQALRHIYKTQGVRNGLYSGLGASFLGASTVTIQMSLYERFKRMRVPIPIASAASMAIAATITYPHEVIRARMQVDSSKGITGLVRHIWQQEGVSGLYSGLGTSLLRLTLASGITFTIYESLLHM